MKRQNFSILNVALLILSAGAIALAQTATTQISTTQPAVITITVTQTAPAPPISPATAPAVVPAVATQPAYRYASDAWKAQFAAYQDADGFVQWEKVAADPGMGYAVFYVGPAAPDYSTYGAAQQAARAVTGKPAAIFFRRIWPGGIVPNNVMGGTSIELPGGSPARPTIIAPTGDVANPRPVFAQGLALAGPRYGAANLVIADLDFAKSTDGQEAGIRLGGSPGGYLWIDDCRTTGDGTSNGFHAAIEINQPSGLYSTVVITRCVATACAGFHYSFYFNNLADLDCEECCIDRTRDAGGAKTIFAHNVYDQFFGSATVAPADPQHRYLSLLTSNASSHGIQLRPGGVISDLYSYANPLAGFVAGNAGGASRVSGVIEGGSGSDLGISGQARGSGFQANGSPSAYFDLLCINKADPINNGPAVEITSQNAVTQAASPVSFTGRIILHNWTGAGLIVDNGSPAKLDLLDCDWGGQVAPGISLSRTYVDPTRVLDLYAKSLGLKDAAAFLSAAAENRRGHWDARLTARAAVAWVRAGFTLKN